MKNVGTQKFQFSQMLKTGTRVCNFSVLRILKMSLIQGYVFLGTKASSDDSVKISH